LRAKGSIGHAFTVCIHTENPNRASFCPFALREISVPAELALGHLRYRLTDVPPQPNSPPNNVLRRGSQSRVDPHDRTRRCLATRSAQPCRLDCLTPESQPMVSPPTPCDADNALTRATSPFHPVSKIMLRIVVFHLHACALPLMLHFPNHFTESD
jgi:hypothetical protein